MCKWCQIMVQEGSRRVGPLFTEELLEQWWQLPVVIEEYLYVGMDYHGDQLVCMCDVFVFIFIHRVVELVDSCMIICIE